MNICKAKLTNKHTYSRNIYRNTKEHIQPYLQIQNAAKYKYTHIDTLIETQTQTHKYTHVLEHTHKHKHIHTNTYTQTPKYTHTKTDKST